MRFLHRFLKDKSGATAIEYALIAALMAVVIIAGITALGGDLQAALEDIGACLADPANCT